MKCKCKKIWLLCLALLLMTGCGTMVLPQENTETADVENELLYITDNDRNTEYSSPINIDLDETEEDFVIEKGGEYVLTGNLKHTLLIDAHDEMVHLFFNGVNMETAIGPAIAVESGAKTIITLMEGSENTVFDAAYHGKEDMNGAISAACDLTINGNGTLYVCGYYKDAIYTKDVFKLIGGNVQIKSKRYGIKGNDGMVLAPQTLGIESEKDGCQTSNHDKEGKGVIDIREGRITIVAGEYGLSAASDVYIRGGENYINSVIADIYTEGQQHVKEGAVIDE